MSNDKNHIAQPFRVHSYGRSELAMLYYPNVAPMTAWRKLRAAIEYYPGLTDHLHRLGYRRSSRTFTPAQVKAIIDAIGEP